MALTREQALVAWDTMCDVFPNHGTYAGDAGIVIDIKGEGESLMVQVELRGTIEAWYPAAQLDPGRDITHLMSFSQRHDMYDGQGARAPLVKEGLTRAQVAEESWKARNRPRAQQPWFTGF